jgi:hypothetical protein
LSYLLSFRRRARFSALVSRRLLAAFLFLIRCATLAPPDVSTPGLARGTPAGQAPETSAVRRLPSRDSSGADMMISWSIVSSASIEHVKPRAMPASISLRNSSG